MNPKKLFLTAGALLLAFATQVSATTITAIYGSGNPDTGWTAFTAGGTQIGLRGKNATTGATPNDGLGNYSFALGEVWNFDLSYNSGTAPLSSYSYSMQVSGPGIVFGVPFSPTLYLDNSYGTGATANGAGVEGSFAALGGTNTVMQLSQRITFGPFFGSFANPGVYTISAQMIAPTGQVINSGSINVNVGAQVPEAGHSLMLLGLGLVALGVIRRVRGAKAARA